MRRMAPRKDLYQLDASQRERSTLEYVLQAEKKLREPTVPVVTVERALGGAGVYEPTTVRNVVRVLFVSSDETLLNPTQQSLDGLVKLSDLFDEVHVLILRQGIETKYPVLRVAKNVWLYTATARHWWWTPVAGLRLIHEQLVFVGGLRPDLIVARDPFESALVARIASNRYGRPAQLHVLVEYMKAAFLKGSRHNRWRRWLARYTVPRFRSVRTATHALEATLEKRYPIADLATLPRFNNYEMLMDAPVALDLAQIYKPFVFFMVYVGKLGHESTFYRVLDAARSFLHNPRVGLLVLGDGSARKEFEKRADLLGIRRQVVFETRVTDPLPYIKAAHVLVVTDQDSEADEVAVRAAAVGTPLVATRNAFRDDVFEHGTSALLCGSDNAEEMQQHISSLVNDMGLRRRLADAAQYRIKERFHDDPETYRRAYRATIERALFIDEDTDTINQPVA